MRKAWVAGWVLSCLVTVALVGERWAQGAAAPLPPAPTEASYAFLDYTVNGRSISDVDKEKWKKSPLHLLPAQGGQPQTYWWTGIRAQYRWTRGGQGLELECRRQWAGDLQRDDRMTLTWKQLLGKAETQGATFYHEILLARGPLQLGSLPPPPNCKDETSGMIPPPPVAERQASRAMQVAQGAPDRSVQGELLLTVNRNNPNLPRATAADYNLWECLVTRGVPNVEFSESVTPGSRRTKEAFVWPDGRFQADLSPSVRYTWSVLPSGCGVGKFEAGQLKGDESIAAGGREKIALACYVIATPTPRYAGCRAWWLVRP